MFLIYKFKMTLLSKLSSLAFCHCTWLSAKTSAFSFYNYVYITSSILKKYIVIVVVRCYKNLAMFLLLTLSKFSSTIRITSLNPQNHFLFLNTSHFRFLCRPGLHHAKINSFHCNVSRNSFSWHFATYHFESVVSRFNKSLQNVCQKNRSKR